MQWLISVAMGLWAVWTWAESQEQERQTRRDRLAALYVNPFMSACEDLQSRIYSILELGGVRVLCKRYPGGARAQALPGRSVCRGDALSHCAVFRMGSDPLALQPVLAGPRCVSALGGRARCILHHRTGLLGGGLQLLPP